MIRFKVKPDGFFYSDGLKLKVIELQRIADISRDICKNDEFTGYLLKRYKLELSDWYIYEDIINGHIIMEIDGQISTLDKANIQISFEETVGIAFHLYLEEVFVNARKNY